MRHFSNNLPCGFHGFSSPAPASKRHFETQQARRPRLLNGSNKKTKSYFDGLYTTILWIYIHIYIYDGPYYMMDFYGLYIGYTGFIRVIKWIIF
jgi:hypothetical protein